MNAWSLYLTIINLTHKVIDSLLKDIYAKDIPARGSLSKNINNIFIISKFGFVACLHYIYCD